ncbi:vacuolar protein sorting-associated protein 54-like [Notothenia coriiceps]|uniref:Vacuolar protein sorting-associated protein 54-like n=1 Tax=Notothenia coriiceps TaxID=8208 RepID=A0A6I9PGQ1_9TELE|nr:PREDICTED: vacuolar protein sorting-associated protein 54-like [Notothenia coriiceps]
MMTFPQWFQLLKNVFESFLLFLQRIKATQTVIKNVVLEVLASTQKLRLLEEAALVQEAPPGPELLQGGGAELAYLTHEGLFISDALNEAQQGVQDQSSVGGARNQDQSSVGGARNQDQSSVGGARLQQRDSASGYTETSVSREQSYM